MRCNTSFLQQSPHAALSWAPHNVASRYVLTVAAAPATSGGDKTCPALSTLTPNAAGDCLAGRHIMIAGDSTFRYMYLALVRLLQGARRGDGKEWTPPPPSTGDCPRDTCPIDYAPKWSGWGGFYHGTNHALEGRELCDCGRGNGVIQELRMYYNPAIGVRVTYLFRSGVSDVRHHSLSELGETCMATAHAASRASLLAGQGVGPPAARCQQGVCKAGSCLNVGGVRKLDQYGGLVSLAAALQPDLIVVNVGHWTRGDAGKLVKLGQSLRKGPSAPALVWATTTANAPSSKLVLQPQLEKALAEDGWRMWHTGAATVPLRVSAGGGKGKSRKKARGVKAYYDNVHVQGWVNDALVKLLLADLCSDSVEW